LGLVALGALALSKGKALLGLLKLASLGKLTLTSLSMLVMVWYEAKRYGFPFAVGFVLLILIHELGHGAAIKAAGLSAGWPLFIPGFGAMIALKGVPRTAAIEAEIAYAGPLYGTFSSLVAAGLYFLLHQRLFLALAYTGFFLNLFNLIPVPPLDGGRVAASFSRSMSLLGALLLGALFLWASSPQLLVIAVLALMHGLRRASSASEQEPATPEERRTWALRYFGLCGFLALAMMFAKELLDRRS